MEPCNSLSLSLLNEELDVCRFKYTLNRRGREGQCDWRCADRMCPGRAITSENDELLSTKEHNHEGNGTWNVFLEDGPRNNQQQLWVGF